MEHPFLVEEYFSEQAPRAVPQAARIPEPESLAALPPLPNLPASDALLLTPADPQYADYLPAANLRTELAPALRAVCKTENAVAVMTDWVRSNSLSFAVRCGGHSYEIFSQSTDVVIDLRGMQDITVDTSAGLVTAGAGVSLYDVYQELANVGYAFPAGSCPTVGIAGHSLGGGFGLLARSHGLTCDSLQQVTLINAQAATLEATATSEPDLFWACRGIAHLSPERRAGIRRLVAAVATEGGARFQRLAKLGSKCPQHHHLHHETGSHSRERDLDAVHWAVRRLTSRAEQRTFRAGERRGTVKTAEHPGAELSGFNQPFLRRAEL